MIARRLQGRVSLVTGAGRMRGIGRAAALRLASEGAAVAVTAAPRDPATFPDEERQRGWKGAASVADEIAALGGKAIALDCDVTDPAQIDAAIAAATQRFGVPDAIVSNAGTAGGSGGPILLDLDDDAWDRTLAINLTGTYRLCKAAGRALREAGKPGAIVTISSASGRVGMANFGGYCASKFGVVGLTQQLARFGIRVNCVSPGMTETDMAGGTFARMADRAGMTDHAPIKRAALKALPLRRAGEPEEQAAAIAFLLGPDASYITGQTVNVDGGMRFD